MIGQELILLGLLKEGPKHGYEIKKRIEEILFLFAGVDLKSIYYPLEVFEKKGLVIKHQSKQGNRPQRFVYELTAKGRQRFDELLNKSFLDFKRPQFSLDLSLYFLRFLEPKTALRRLQARLSIIKKLDQTLQQTLAAFSGKNNSALCRIIEHNLQMVQTESAFLLDLIESLNKGAVI